MKTFKYSETTINHRYEPAKEEDFKFTFDSPSQFLEFLGEWKANYKELSGKIRYAKAHRKTSRDDYDPDSHSALYGYQREARNQMILRKAAKDAGKVKQAASRQKYLASVD